MFKHLSCATQYAFVYSAYTQNGCLLKKQKVIHRIRKYMMRATIALLDKIFPSIKDCGSLLHLKHCLPLNVIVKSPETSDQMDPFM